MQAKIEMITPSYAKQLLGDMVTNRNISEPVVLRYAKEMAAGNWQMNGQNTIVLTEDGKLLDGQHRMHAVIRADVNVGMLVVRGIPQENFVTIDSGRARRFSDVLGIEGYKNTIHLAASARNAYNYISGEYWNGVVGKGELSKFVQDYPYLTEMSNHLRTHRGKGPVAKLAINMATVMFLANARHRFDPEVGEFVEGVATGQGLFAGDARLRLRLREWIMNHDTRTKGLKSDAMFGAVVRAWNAYSQGEALALIRPIPSPHRDNVKIRGFERSFFQTVKDVPKVPFLPTPPGKNIPAHATVDQEIMRAHPHR